MEYLTDQDYVVAAKIGLKKTTVYARVYSNGWSVDRAINTKTMKRTDKRGSVYEKYYAIGEKNGISNKVVFQRYHYSGWSLEDACTVPVRKYSRKGLVE